MRTAPLLLLLIGCAEGVPAPCPSMCAAAAPLVEECLESDGLGWSATTWGDEQGFVDSCLTWAWEQQRLERDARHRGEAEGSGHTAAACEVRRDAFEDPLADCATYESIDWDAGTWEPR
jgi:hypothetical protein